MLQPIIALSRDFVRAEVTHSQLTSWSAVQYRIFALILAKIDWKNGNNSHIIEVDYEKTAAALGWSVQGGNFRKSAYTIREELKYMRDNSEIEVDDPYTGKKSCEKLIYRVKDDAAAVCVYLNPVFMPHLEGLYSLVYQTKKTFITFSLEEFLKLNSKYAYPLLLDLKSCGTVGGTINQRTLSTKTIKEYFGLSEDSYMRLNKKTGASEFDRYNFEKNVLVPAISAVNSTSMVKILPWEDDGGKYYHKEKNRKDRVLGYIFRYQIFNTSAQPTGKHNQ